MSYLNLRSLEILRFARGTCVTDSRGMPLVVYHGTFANFDRFEITKDIGFHFGSFAAAERRRKHAPLRPVSGSEPQWRVIAACLRIERPVVLEVDPANWEESYFVDLLKQVIPSTVISEMNEKLNQSRIESASAFKKFQALYDQLRSFIVVPDEKIQEQLLAGRRRIIGYSIDHAREDLLKKRGKKLAKLIYKEHPEWNIIHKPHEIIKEVLLNAGYDGIGYINWYEQKNSSSWVVFDNEAILQLGHGEIPELIEARTEDMCKAGYSPNENPLREPPVDIRTPNWGYLKDREIIRLNSAIIKQGSARPNFSNFRRSERSLGWRERSVSLNCRGIEFYIKTSDCRKFDIPIRRVEGDILLPADPTDMNASASPKDTVPGAPKYIPFTAVEWPMGANLQAAADLILDKIEEFASKWHNQHRHSAASNLSFQMTPELR